MVGINKSACTARFPDKKIAIAVAKGLSIYADDQLYFVKQVNCKIIFHTDTAKHLLICKGIK